MQISINYRKPARKQLLFWAMFSYVRLKKTIRRLKKIITESIHFQIHGSMINVRFLKLITRKSENLNLPQENFTTIFIIIFFH